jgi:hypothetical protein
MMFEWNNVIIVMSFMLLCFLLWNEVIRTNKLRLIWRIIASVLAVVSLACIALPVILTVKETVTASKEAILLTDGFNNDSIKSFLNNTSKHYEVYTTDPGVLQSAQSFKPKLLSALEILNQPSEKINTIHVFGYGLKDDELQKYGKINLAFHPAEVPAGITSISWKRKLTSGDKLLVQGNFNNNSPKEAKLILRGLQTNLDSVVIPPNTARNFQLSTIPKHLHRAVYNLIAVNKLDMVETEDIPVEVIQLRSFQILMLAASPDFENKFLKNRLSQNGYAVAIRNRISKDKFQKEFLNVSSISLDNITAPMLDKFDVLIADTDELSFISKSELQIIQSAVQNKGLGLIVKAESSISSTSFYSKSFSFLRRKENLGKSSSLFLKNANDIVLKLFIEHPVPLRSTAGTQPLIYDDKYSVFVNSTICGNGKIIITTLENTYTLLLSGNYKNYDEVWSLLLNKAAKKFLYKEVVVVSPALPKLNEPAFLSIQNTDHTLEPIQVGDDKIYLQQDRLLPFIQTGIYWPKQTGWIPQVDTEGKINWLYVYKNNDWSTINAVNKLRVTGMHASQNPPRESKNNVVKKEVPLSVPKIYFFLIFIMSSGFLWFEKKLT